ncbi:MAG: hypothetical protein ACEPO2_03105 [Pelagibaca sp.]
MSQSQSLTEALEAVERVLDAKTGDLRELAKIADVAPEVLFLRADLSGVDLRGQDISFLLPLEVSYLGAKLNDHQLRAFRQADRERRAVRLREDQKLANIQLVENFLYVINQSENIRSGKMATENSILLTMRETLLFPLLEDLRRNERVPKNYMADALFVLGRNRIAQSTNFTSKLFSLFNDLDCEITPEAIKALDESWLGWHGAQLGELIGLLRRDRLLDSYWLLKDEVVSPIEAARQININRSVDVGSVELAIEKRLLSLPEYWRFILEFLSVAEFECNSHQAERLAAPVVNAKWAATETANILETKTHPRVKTALFRQILSQGKEKRIVELVKWLDGNRGAAGALSLDNAFLQIKEFDLGLDLATRIAARLSDNQLAILDSNLSRMAYREGDRARLNAFRRRFIHNN